MPSVPKPMSAPKSTDLGAKPMSAPDDGSDNSGGSGYPSYSYGSGGSGIDSKKLQEQLGGVSGYNFKTPEIIAGYGDKIYDENDAFLEESKDEQLIRAAKKYNDEWYKQYQNEQAITSQLTDALGNAKYTSSGQNDFWDLIATRADQDAVSALNEYREAGDNILQDLYEGLQDSINNRNKMYMDAEEAQRSVAADYVAQSNNIDPDLATSMVDTKNHTLKLPDWLTPGIFDKNFRSHQSVDSMGLTRPANSAVDANNKNLLGKDSTSAFASASNTDYWTSRNQNGYSRRTQ